jgi:3D (Asp-Asp-Asp) domain-containing protein
MLLLAGCATRSLPKFEKPLKRSEHQRVRTTAYTHTEGEHRRYEARSALGTPLRYGEVTSAAADWSRWPAGTVFRVRETGRLYEVDDYGWALAGTNTIDLYMPTRQAMNTWGVRRVTIQILRWGDLERSYRVLRPRAKHRHVKRMVRQIEAQR